MKPSAEEELYIYKAELEIQNEELRSAQLSLEEQRHRYFSLFDLAPVGYIVRNKYGIVENANFRACALLGVERQILIGQPCSAFVFMEDRDIYYRHNRALWESKEPQSYELRLQHYSGKVLWVHLDCMLENGGDSTRSWDTFTDISEFKRSVEESSAVSAKYKEIFDSSPIAIEFFSSDAKLQVVNAACLDLFGVVDEQELLGFDLFSDPNVLDVYKEQLRSGEVVRYQSSFSFDIVREAGTYETSRTGSIIIDVVITPLAEVGGYLVQVQDVSAQRKAEETLRQSEDKFSKAFYNSPDAVVITRMQDGVIVEANEGWRKLAGSEAVIGKSTVAMWMWADSHDRERVVAALSGGEAVVGWEIDFRTPSGVINGFYSGAVLVLDGEPYVLSIVRDVTAQKEAEAEICRLNDELERRVADRTNELFVANQNIESFAYTVSHDLRAPLRHISGFAGLLKVGYSALLDIEGLHYLDAIQASVKTMDALTDGLIQFSRSGSVNIVIEKIDMAALVHNLVANIESQAQWTIEDLPVIQGDVTLLTQIWNNLFENAVKFSRDSNPPKINVGYCPSGGELFFYVKDNGCGFDRRYASKLFGVFQKLNTTFEGTGIGLATVKRAVGKLGGRVYAESTLGEGATFYFSLPEVNYA